MRNASLLAPATNSTFARSPGIVVLLHDLKAVISLMTRLSTKHRKWRTRGAVSLSTKSFSLKRAMTQPHPVKSCDSNQDDSQCDDERDRPYVVRLRYPDIF